MKTVLECVTLTRDHVTINTKHFGIMCIPCNVATAVMSAYLEGVLKTLPHDPSSRKLLPYNVKRSPDIICSFGPYDDGSEFAPVPLLTGAL